jgi:hypothetical protein
MRITNAYLERVLTASETDPIVAGQFMRVVGMIDPPVRLLRPSILRRIARAHRFRRTDPRPADESRDTVRAG